MTAIGVFTSHKTKKQVIIWEWFIKHDLKHDLKIHNGAMNLFFGPSVPGPCPGKAQSPCNGNIYPKVF